MPLESATYVNQLVDTNPAHTDQISEADSHLRLIKQALLDTFPNMGAAVTVTPAQLNALTGLTGMVSPFVAATSDPNWLRLNGGTFLYTDHPALGTMLGYSSGTCTLPNMEDTGRFARSVSAGITPLTAQANTLAAHTHTGSVTSTGTTSFESADHTHSFSGTTSGQSVDHTHTDSVAYTSGNQKPNSGGTAPFDANTTGTTGGTSNDHTHSYSGTTSGISANHTHTFSATGSFTTAATGGAETRPEALTFIFYVHV